MKPCERARTRSRRQTAGAVDGGKILAARAVEAAGRTRQALQLYVSARAHDDVARILVLHGFELHERGAADVVAAAISSLPPETRRSSAIALILEATAIVSRTLRRIGVVVRTGPAPRARRAAALRVDVAFALELLRRGRADAFERLEALAPLAADDAASVVILASLATAHAAAGRLRQAETCIAEALNALPNVDDVAIRATVHQRSAFVAPQPAMRPLPNTMRTRPQPSRPSTATTNWSRWRAACRTSWPFRTATIKPGPWRRCATSRPPARVWGARSSAASR